MENLDGPILLIGCGKMGDALLRGWLDRGVTASDVTVIETSEQTASAARDRGVATLAAFDKLPNNFAPRVVVFAVKPQVMLDVVPPYRRLVGPNTMFLSIAAGKALAFFETHLGADAAVIRAMPNTPAAIGLGMTVVCANAGASSTDRELAEKLMTAAGAVAWIEDEALVDAATAVSGGREVGHAGQLQPAVAAAHGFPDGEAVYVVELWLDPLTTTEAVRVRALPRHPTVTRDISILVADTVLARDIRATITNAAPDTLDTVVEFDRYQGNGVPDGQVSLSLHLTFRASDRTLTDGEVDAAMDAVVAQLAAAHQAIRR